MILMPFKTNESFTQDTCLQGASQLSYLKQKAEESTNEESPMSKIPTAKSPNWQFLQNYKKYDWKVYD